MVKTEIYKFYIQHPTGLVEKMVRPLNSTKAVVSTKTVVCCRQIERLMLRRRGANANYVVIHIMIHGYGWVLFYQFKTTLIMQNLENQMN